MLIPSTCLCSMFSLYYFLLAIISFISQLSPWAILPNTGNFPLMLLPSSPVRPSAKLRSCWCETSEKLVLASRNWAAFGWTIRFLCCILAHTYVRADQSQEPVGSWEARWSLFCWAGARAWRGDLMESWLMLFFFLTEWLFWPVPVFFLFTFPQVVKCSTCFLLKRTLLWVCCVVHRVPFEFTVEVRQTITFSNQ